MFDAELSVSTRPACLTAVTSVDSAGLAEAAVATGALDMPLKLPAPDFGTDEQGGPKSTAAGVPEANRGGRGGRRRGLGRRRSGSGRGGRRGRAARRGGQAEAHGQPGYGEKTVLHLFLLLMSRQVTVTTTESQPLAPPGRHSD